MQSTGGHCTISRVRNFFAVQVADINACLAFVDNYKIMYMNDFHAFGFAGLRSSAAYQGRALRSPVSCGCRSRDPNRKSAPHGLFAELLPEELGAGAEAAALCRPNMSPTS